VARHVKVSQLVTDFTTGLLRLACLLWKQEVHLEDQPTGSPPSFDSVKHLVEREVIAHNALLVIKLARERRRLAAGMRPGERPTVSAGESVDGLFSKILGDKLPSALQFQVALEGRKPLFQREIARCQADSNPISAGESSKNFFFDPGVG
jgi:hypothetical protein